MPRADKSTAILTGMIIAALYVILLVGFTQESYMRKESYLRREIDMRRDAAGRSDGSAGWPVIHDVSKRVCRIEPPLCAGLLADADDRQSCTPSIETARRLVSEPVVTLEGLRRAMREGP